jgi:RHS repeat-associated protein
VGLLAKIAGNTRLFHIEADALGSPRAVIDPTRSASGMVVWRWELPGEAFGNDRPDEDPDGDGIAFVFDLRYPGQQYDSATGFNYNYFRDYDPGVGRYVQSDPIGLNGGMSTYGYVFSNSLTLIDPFGLQDGPGFSDQINQLGTRIDNEANYTSYFENRFPNTIAGAKAVFTKRIKEKVCKQLSGQPQTVSGLTGGGEDIDIKPNMARFGDKPQGIYERNVAIGRFELKTTDINVSWDNASTMCSTCFYWSSQMYVLENTGDDRLRSFFAERQVVMGRWNFNGRACCDR